MAKKKSSRKKWIFLALFIIIIAVVAVMGTQGGQKGIEVTVKTVDRGDITSLVTATGKVQPEMEVLISSEAPGEIIELPIKDGDTVEKGDLLVRVNPDTLEAQVKQQEAGLAATKSGALQRRAEMLQSELDLKRVEDLSTKGFATQDELEQMRTRLEVSKAAYQSSLHQIDRQDMQLQEASDQLAKASSFSPITGTVVLLSKEIGDRVVGTGQFQGTEIMRVADLTNMEVRIEVSEADIVNVQIGDKSKIEIDAIPDEIFDGIVTEIANSARTTGSRTQEELTTFEVKIKLVNPGDILRPGMTATADIETETVEAVIRAPLESVVVRPRREVEKDKEEGDEEKEDDEESEEENSSGNNGKKEKDDRVRVIFVAEDGVASLREVETGIADQDFMEIKSGIEEGEKIITGSYRALTRELKDESEIIVPDKKNDKKKD